MSFGSSQNVKNNQNQLLGETQQANQNAGNLNAAGGTSLSAGSSNTTNGTNFFNTLLNGNQANTAALLAPTLNADRQQSQQQLQSLSTLTPRGGGRSGTLFNAAYQPSASIQNAFMGGRLQAAQTLPQIGLQQQGIGTSLYGLGNQALNTATGATGTNLNSALQVQQQSNQLAGGIGSAIMGLALAPVTGGGSLFGNLVNCWIAEALYGRNDIRTHVLRAWLNGPFRRTIAGDLVMRLYLLVGRQVASLVRTLPFVGLALRPLFEAALLKAVCRPSIFVEMAG